VVLFASGEGTGSVFLGFLTARAVQLQGTLGLAASAGPFDLVLQGGQRVLWGSARSQDPYRDQPDQNASLNQTHGFVGLMVGMHFDARGRSRGEAAADPIETSPRAR
jgi:hypothetical protein